jgi:hypothetical protein
MGDGNYHTGVWKVKGGLQAWQHELGVEALVFSQVIVLRVEIILGGASAT